MLIGGSQSKRSEVIHPRYRHPWWLTEFFLLRFTFYCLRLMMAMCIGAGVEDTALYDFLLSVVLTFISYYFVTVWYWEISGYTRL